MKIESFLFSLGISPAYSGFYYLVDMILCYERDPRCKFWALYSDIADRYNTTVQTVERCARTCIKAAIDKHGPDNFIELLEQEPQIDTGSYRVSDFVALCSFALKRLSR